MGQDSTTNESNEPIYWDPYRPDICANPYGIYKRLREEAPLWYNEEYDFYMVSRFADVETVLADKDSFSSGRGDILEVIKSDMEIPSGMFIWEDPPIHTAHRSILARAFTPRRMNALETMIRDYCVRLLDPLVGRDKLDLLEDFGTKLPGGVIGMMLGIPDEDRDSVREHVDASLRTEEGKPLTQEQVGGSVMGYDEYVEWRMKNPADDLITELLGVEFKDEQGKMRNLTQDEVLVFVGLLAGAGNETTSRLIGWIGKVLGEHPDQRREIAANPALIPAAVEEILRFEPPSTQIARYVTRDVEFHGTKIPAGSAIQALVAAANRDESRFVNGDTFDIHREGPSHITFGRGIHACIGASLARIEGRIAMEEILKRFPDWTVDTENAELSSSSTTRGWDTMPVFIG